MKGTVTAKAALEGEGFVTDVLTQKEADALSLSIANVGYGRIGLMLGISKSTARDRVQRALRKLAKQQEDE
jgi:DNA-directed RNA polymerase specialized sigma24 family protein